MKKVVFVLGGLLILSGLSACAKSSHERGSIPQGRCVVNDDCGPGFRCTDTFCVDLYNPDVSTGRERK